MTGQVSQRPTKKIGRLRIRTSTSVTPSGRVSIQEAMEKT